MSVDEIMIELQSKANEGTKKVLMKHGIKEPLFGVKIEDLKIIQKKVKKDYNLSKQLYSTGNADAMYLAGLIADEQKMTRADLEKWIRLASSPNIIEYTVPWIAAESRFGFELGSKWIASADEKIVAAGWSTLASLVAIKADDELDLPSLKKLLEKLEKEFQSSGSLVRHNMNRFVIAIGGYVIPLMEKALSVAEKISAIKNDRDGSPVKPANATGYILKMKNKGITGRKKKMARC
jgi:3-methyladenine DNA glycosylase AlkD